MAPRFPLFMPLLVGLILGLMATVPAAAEPRDVFIFIGQSNMAGRTPFGPSTSTGESDYSVAAMADLFNPNGGWTQASNLTSRDPEFDLPDEFRGFNRYSNVADANKSQLYNPGLAFANTLYNFRSEHFILPRRLGLVFNARGRTIVAHWQKHASPVGTESDGMNAHGVNLRSKNLYDLTLDRAITAKLAGSVHNEIKGLIIDLGAGDALQKTQPDVYLSGLKSLVADFRADLQLPELPVFIGQQPYLRAEDYQGPGPNRDAAEYSVRLNAVLSQWAASDTKVYLVRSGGAGLQGNTSPDSAHFDHAGMDQMGKGYARAVAEFVYNHKPHATTQAAANFSPDHGCSSSFELPLCILALRIKRPDWSLAQDLVVLPHRGYWGFGDALSVPENSIAGYTLVKTKGYGMSEVDFTASSDLRPFPTGGQATGITAGVMSHDYILYRVTDYPRNVDPKSSDPLFSDVSSYWWQGGNYRLRDRLGKPTNQPVPTQSAAVSTLTNNQLLTVADIKQKSSTDANQFAINWVLQLASIMYDYQDRSALHTLSVKTSYTPSFIIANLPADLKDDFSKVLWIPQVGSAYVKDTPSDSSITPTPGMGSESSWIATSTDYIDIWQAYWPSIINFEINYKSSSDSRLGTFTKNGFSYSNMLDYAKQTTNYRGGVFSEEPIAPRGNVNRNGGWSIKNADTDTRGDPLFEAFTPQWGKFIVVTTDRPDIWKAMLCQFYGSSC